MTALVQQRDCCCSRSSLSDAVCAQDALGGLIYIRWWNDLTHSRRHERHAQQLQNANSLERRSCTKKRSTALANYFRKAFCHGSVTWLSLRCVCVSWTTSGPWRHWDCSAVTKQHGWEAETSSRADRVLRCSQNSSLQHNASWISPTSASEVLRVTRSSACVTGLNGHVQVHTVVSPVQNPDRTQLSVLALSSEHGGLEGKKRYSCTVCLTQTTPTAEADGIERIYMQIGDELSTPDLKTTVTCRLLLYTSVKNVVQLNASGLSERSLYLVVRHKRCCISVYTVETVSGA